MDMKDPDMWVMLFCWICIGVLIAMGMLTSGT